MSSMSGLSSSCSSRGETVGNIRSEPPLLFRLLVAMFSGCANDDDDEATNTPALRQMVSVIMKIEILS